jgi:hypothetical protein
LADRESLAQVKGRITDRGDEMWFLYSFFPIEEDDNESLMVEGMTRS